MSDVHRRAVLAGAAAATFVPWTRALAATGPVDLEPLSRGFDGILLAPSSPTYEPERKSFAFNPRSDRFPAVIAKCRTEGDIVRALAFAQHQGLDIAVRGGRHDVMGASNCDGGVVIDTRLMASCALQPDGKTVVVGAGAKAGEVMGLLQRTGLAVPFGDSGDVGVAGLTLGGGYGWLAGAHGATCDSLIQARLVLASGEVVTASARENPDLFWAIRGGGGNFGVVSQLSYRTCEVDQVTAGRIIFSADDIPGFFRFYREFMANCPDNLAIELGVIHADRLLVSALACWSGEAEAGERALAPLLAHPSLLASAVSRRPYSQLAASAPAIDVLLRSHRSGPAGPQDAVGAFWRGGSLAELSDGAIAQIVSRLSEARDGFAFSLTHHLHGAVCRIPSAETALIRPLGSYCFHFDAWWGDPSEAERQMQWVDTSLAALAPYRIPTYVNYLSSDDPKEIAKTYGRNFSRLRQIKRRYDPSNILHHNRNIPPAA